ncbi:MAG: hypothetical protein ACE5GY_08780 [Thermodesulfobacteriota bacterium]
MANKGTRIILAMVAIAASVSLVSCTGGDKNDGPPSSREIMKKYTETLTGARSSAHDAADAAQERNRAQEDALKGL